MREWTGHAAPRGTGATVVAVDALEEMLDAARRRAPGATFVGADLLVADLGTGHDRAVLSFVLHNFGATGRTEVLRRAAEAVRPGGRIGILEWAPPGPGLNGRLWRRLLHRLEPSRSVGEILDGGLDRDLTSAGLRATRRETLRGARVQLVVAVAPGAVGRPGAGASPASSDQRS